MIDLDERDFCPMGEQFLLLFLEARLNPEENRQFQTHLKSCPICSIDSQDFPFQELTLQDIKKIQIKEHSLDRLLDGVLRNISQSKGLELKEFPEGKVKEVPRPSNKTLWKTQILAMAGCFLFLWVLPTHLPKRTSMGKRVEKKGGLIEELKDFETHLISLQTNLKDLQNAHPSLEQALLEEEKPNRASPSKTPSSPNPGTQIKLAEPEKIPQPAKPD